MWLGIFVLFLVAYCDKLYLTIAYCPDEFTGKGAVVEVDQFTGEYKIVGKFDWPDLFGCVALYDPTITYNHAKNQLILDFIDEFGEEQVVDTPKAKIERVVKPKDPFMIGFVNMAYDDHDDKLVGVVPTGEKTGEYQWMKMNFKTGKVEEEKFIEFKAMMDDSHYLDEKNKIFWIQASYDQRDVPHCAPADTDLCMLKLNSETGELLSAKFTNWTIYKYNRYFNEDGTIKVFMNGFDEVCKHPYSEFLFATVDLEKAEAKPIACLPKNITIQEEEWISSFSKDGKYWATGSRFDGNTQFLVFDTDTAQPVLNSKLVGLAEALGAFGKLFWIWAVNFEH